MPINSADTAWVLVSAAMVMLMTPGVAFFYGGMVRRKNFLSTLMMCFVTLGLIGLLWVIYGYSLSFGPDKGGIIGGLNFVGLLGVGQTPSYCICHHNSATGICRFSDDVCRDHCRADYRRGGGTD